MKTEQMIEALESAATQLGIRVRYDVLPMGGAAAAGGLCKVKGEWQVIIDKKSSPSERAGILTEALASFDTEAVFLPPKLREAVQLRREMNATATAEPEPIKS
jgi:hypothetical protein